MSNFLIKSFIQFSLQFSFKKFITLEF